MTVYVRRRPRRIDVYTDGACSGSPGPGGWAWAVDLNDWDTGAERSTTNQRMEMMAALQAVTQVAGPICIVTDSAYVMNCFTQRWYRNWADGHKDRGRGTAVANWDLWSRLIPAVMEGDVTWRKVKGHSGDPMNDFVDSLAVRAKKALMV